MTEQEQILLLKTIAAKTRAMLELQKQFFKSKNKATLIRAKQYEADVKRLINQYDSFNNPLQL